MTNFFNRYATPLITGYFLVSLITGVALFVHVGPQAFREMHEILSLVLILPFVLHLWKNWRPVMAYLRHAPMALALVFTVLTTLPFFMESEGGTAGGPPQFAFVRAALAHDLATVAPLFDTDATALAQKLTEAGFTLPAADATLSQIAEASGKTEADLAAALTATAE